LGNYNIIGTMVHYNNIIGTMGHYNNIIRTMGHYNNIIGTMGHYNIINKYICISCDEGYMLGPSSRDMHKMARYQYLMNLKSKLRETSQFLILI